MATVALLEVYALAPPDWAEDNEPFVLTDDNIIVSYKWSDPILKHYKHVTVAEFLPVKSMVLCHDENGEHVFRKLLWKEYYKPNIYNPKGAWELGFSKKVIRGQQADSTLMLPHEAIVVKQLKSKTTTLEMQPV